MSPPEDLPHPEKRDRVRCAIGVDLGTGRRARCCGGGAGSQKCHRAAAAGSSVCWWRSARRASPPRVPPAPIRRTLVSLRPPRELFAQRSSKSDQGRWSGITFATLLRRSPDPRDAQKMNVTREFTLAELLPASTVRSTNFGARRVGTRRRSPNVNGSIAFATTASSAVVAGCVASCLSVPRPDKVTCSRRPGCHLSEPRRTGGGRWRFLDERRWCAEPEPDTAGDHEERDPDERRGPAPRTPRRGSICFGRHHLSPAMRNRGTAFFPRSRSHRRPSGWPRSAGGDSSERETTLHSIRPQGMWENRGGCAVDGRSGDFGRSRIFSALSSRNCSRRGGLSLMVPTSPHWCWPFIRTLPG